MTSAVRKGVCASITLGSINMPGGVRMQEALGGTMIEESKGSSITCTWDCPGRHCVTDTRTGAHASDDRAIDTHTRRSTPARARAATHSTYMLTSNACTRAGPPGGTGTPASYLG